MTLSVILIYISHIPEVWTLNEEDKARIELKLEEMMKYIYELQEMMPSDEEYHTNLVRRRACEKTIEIAIDSLIDIASMIVASERFGLPIDEGNIIDLIAEHNVIDKELGEKIKDMKGFRNILVHRYGHVDDEIVYRILLTGLSDFYDFEKQVDRYLKTRVTK
jgi:uncharacterized protein YutE (UPF0331/DUF86 family)